MPLVNNLYCMTVISVIISKLNTHSLEYNIPRDCGRCYIGETGRPMEVHIKDDRYNLTQSLLGKSKVDRDAYEEGHHVPNLTPRHQPTRL
jgi:hypothetical protein